MNRCKLNLFGDVCLTISDYKNTIYVHIRYYDGKYPTKKGVALPLPRWKNLLQMMPKILDFKRDGKSFREHIGGNCYISMTDGIPGIDIRDFWMPEGELNVKATKRGVFFRNDNFDEFVEMLPRINSYLPELDETTTCMMSEDHQNQEGALRCKECNPNEYHMW